MAKPKDEVKAYFCPKCKSTDVKYVFGFGNIFGIIPKQQCGSCKLEGIFPLLVTSKRALAKHTKAKTKVKVNQGVRR